MVSFVVQLVSNTIPTITFDSQLKERVLPMPATDDERFEYIKHRCEMEQKQNQSIGERVHAFPRRSYLYTSNIDCLLDMKRRNRLKRFLSYFPRWKVISDPIEQKYDEMCRFVEDTFHRYGLK